MSTGTIAAESPRDVASPPSTHCPYVVGRYTIHNQIAAGGLGSVHFARLVGAQGFARTVVAKRPHAQFARDPEFALMFIDEARLAARIRHANVVSTLDVIQTSHDLVLVMDYVHGESLCRLDTAATDRDEKIPLQIAASIIIDTLHGLHAAHEATDEQGNPLGIVHRDVSPQNILVGADGIARLVDFGIAMAAGRLQSQTRACAWKGKLGYMAPEQLRGEPISRHTDTYAAAVVFWEMLTGERLFEGRNDAETVTKCLLGRIPRVSRFVPDIPPRIVEILNKALASDPSDRFESARAMALEIEACVPPLRHSGIGAWVQRMAADTLADRAATLAEIERLDTQRDDATIAVERPGSKQEGRSEATQSATRVEPPRAPPKGTPRAFPSSRIVWVGLYALLAGSGGAALSARAAVHASQSPVMLQPPPSPSPAPAPATPSNVPLTVPVTSLPVAPPAASGGLRTGWRSTTAPARSARRAAAADNHDN